MTSFLKEQCIISVPPMKPKGVVFSTILKMPFWLATVMSQNRRADSEQGYSVETV